jgi:hypothetical protein
MLHRRHLLFGILAMVCGAWGGAWPVQADEKATRSVTQMRGLVAFWTFGEAVGTPRQSVGTPQKHVLEVVNGPIKRVEGGPYSGHSALFNGQQYFKIRHKNLKDLNIAGPKAQVSMFAVVRVDDVEKSRTIAGIWSEGRGAHDDRGTRQYAMLLHMPSYGGHRRLVPHISSEGGVTRRADGSGLPWNADYAATKSEVPEKKWSTLAFTYDSKYLRAYINGSLDRRTLDPKKDNRTDRYFTKEGPGGKDRGMNPYYHGRGIFKYNATLHAKTKTVGPSDFTLGARDAGGSKLAGGLLGKLGGLAIFNRALSDAEIKKLHDVAEIEKLK